MTLDHGRALAEADWPAGGGGAVHGGIYLLHGFGEHSGRYDTLARWLAARGWHVAAHDHRGHGRSPGVRGRLVRAPDFAREARARIDAFAARLGRAPVLFGHSMGGALAAELVLQHRCPVAGLVLSSPALRPWMSRIQVLQLGLMRRLAPDWVVGRPVDGLRLSHDPEAVAAYRGDPLVHGMISARLLDWMRRSGARSIEAAASLDRPTLLIGGTADRVVDPQAWREFAARAPAGLLCVELVEGGLHELFNESPDWREPALARLGDWLDRLAANPAARERRSA